MICHPYETKIQQHFNKALPLQFYQMFCFWHILWTKFTKRNKMFIVGIPLLRIPKKRFGSVPLFAGEFKLLRIADMWRSMLSV